MLQLSLIRHAKSSWSNVSLSDFDRPLNNRGKNNAPLMGGILKKRGVTFDLMLSSAAVRAMTTARLIAAEVGYPERDIQSLDRLYASGVEEMLDCVHAIDAAHRRVALVAHNPGLPHFCDYLCGDGIGHFPTCAIAVINFELDSWQAVCRDSGTLALYEYPRKYTG